jgi:hypothetical protein
VPGPPTALVEGQLQRDGRRLRSGGQNHRVHTGGVGRESDANHALATTHGANVVVAECTHLRAIGGQDVAGTAAQDEFSVVDQREAGPA